ncbi:MAG: N-methyl-L-tryptophan oxidase [Thermomicrobiales bacterium]
MSSPKYDVIVIGLGGMGSAAAAHLAKRGQRVLGLDLHERQHTHGSSHGVSRIIREAYFEAPEYVPLVQRAYTLWRELEKETGRFLLTITGGLNIGTPDSEFVSGSLASSAQHDLPHEYLNAAEVAERFPGFRLTDDLVAVYEPNAGYLKPEGCMLAHYHVAEKHGAELRFEEGVCEWSASDGGVRVKTAKRTYDAERLVIAAGPWAGQVMTDLGLPLSVRRIVNVHFRPEQPNLFRAKNFPVYLFQVPEGEYYGFPIFPGRGLKIGRHDIGEPTTPETIRREVDDSEIAMLREVLDRYLPGASGEVRETLTCMYTDTPDSHFIIDLHPEHPNVAIACGFSGHGFKFASAIGEVLADLAIDGETQHDIGFLSAGRFA